MLGEAPLDELRKGTEALKRNQHLRGERVLWRDDGVDAKGKELKVTQVLLAKWMCRAQRKAGLKVTGGIHILRHTFCSRLAMAGATPVAISSMAGHQSLSTTQRYLRNRCTDRCLMAAQA